MFTRLISLNGYCIRLSYYMKIINQLFNELILRNHQYCFSIKLTLNGLFQWYFYVRQRDRPEDWKCQPTKWLSPELEMHEIKIGSISLFLGSIISGVFSCYVSNGGWTTLYYDISEYGWVWFFLQFPLIFIWQVSKAAKLII